MDNQPFTTSASSVRRVLQLVAVYPDRDELGRKVPELEDVRQALLQFERRMPLSRD